MLLVDDNQAILDCLVKMLGRDYTIVGALRDGPRTLDAVAILKPDVVVMDISMPEISGLAIARLLRESPPALPSSSSPFTRTRNSGKRRTMSALPVMW